MEYVAVNCNKRVPLTRAIDRLRTVTLMLVSNKQCTSRKAEINAVPSY